MILPSSEGDLFCAITGDGKICIADTSLRKYMPKYTKLISKRNTITCGCETCISAMLHQSDLHKWRISQLAKLDHLYIDSTSTRILQISKTDFIE